MAALYPYKVLNHIKFKDISVPAQRYVHKFVKQRNEVTKLKHHEKDFLFRVLETLHDADDSHPFNLFKIPEAKEFVFDTIILTHSNQVMVFDGPVPGPYGLLKPNEKRRNKRFFYEYMAVWKNQVEKGEGAYCSVIKPEIRKKIKSWKDWTGTDLNRQKTLKQKTEYIYATFFHIYYRVKLYFDELSKPYVLENIGGFDIVFNVYSFVHILSRHYYPNMNQDIGISMNKEIECFDIEYLPDAIIDLIKKSNAQKALTANTEYLLCSFGGDNYILWMKYKRLNETKADGFEVRSFYKCEEQRDLDKVNEPGAVITEISARA